MEKKQKITLQDIHKKEVFQVPKIYFEQLPSAIGDKISSSQQNKHVFAKDWVKYSISLATACLLLLIGYGWFSTNTNTNAQITGDVSNQEIVEYLQLTDVSAYDIMEAASAANVSIPDSLPEETIIDTELLIDEAEIATLEELI